ncbi:pilus assembly protein TadG-related protein [Demequina sp.]|uniref:pilus assembly protein TadG-related protein n=1 Tax=Demequina sp. TaxID=2050685 RepID=UPI003D112A3C
MSRVRIKDDEGTIMLLTLGFVVLALLIILVISAATQVHLQRMRLTHVADEVALDAADALDVASYYEGSVAQPTDDGVIVLANAQVARIAEERVGEAAARAGLPLVEVVEATTSDDFTATVTVQTVVHPLFGVDALLPFVDGVTLTATSSARAY